MVKKRQKQKQAGKGYAYSGIPPWLVKLQNDALRDARVTQKTRQRTFFIPLWNDKYRFKNIPKKFSKIDAFTLEKSCLYVSNRLAKDTGLAKLVFTPIPNYHTTIEVYEVKPNNDVIFAGATLDEKDKIKASQFLGKIKGEIQYDVAVTKELYEIRARDIINNTPIIIFSETALKSDKIYHVDTFMWQKVISDLERPACVMRPMHYLFNYSMQKPDYEMFADNIKNITCWDDISFQWGYDNETIGLIMAGLMYFEKDMPALNMIVFGDTQIGKSSIFKVLEKLFGDSVIAATKATIKGLTGSAWESWTKGALMSCKYVALIDEIFRLGKQDATSTPSSEMISSLLNSLNEILEHSDKQAPSGKGSQRLYFNKSMIGMNNILDYSIFRKAWATDPAPFNRISILTLGKKTKANMRKLVEDNPISADMFTSMYEDRLLKKKLNLETIRQMFHYGRNVMLKNIVIDNVALSSYMKQSRFVHEDFIKLNKFRALVKEATIFHWIFNSEKLCKPNQKIQPTNADYMQAVYWMDMIGDSFKNVMGLP